ncbi:uncharacterized protein LOC141713116 [Apium graveolens]|uniref:uncharacterized protein LOC141713116 n=1 Tax=Apium graveolens TaxID=4045 RepID=UPI003D7909AE
MPRIAITDNLLEERRVAKQRLNARRSRGNVLSSSSLTSAGQAAPLPVRRKGEVSATESPRRRTHIDKKKRVFGKSALIFFPKKGKTTMLTSVILAAANNTILDIGPQDQACRFCGALVWAAEFTGKHVGMSPKAYSIYCTKGKVQLPLLKETPPELKQLLTGTATREIKFQHNLRMYNIIFALCSFGGSVDESINNGSGPYVFRVNDHVYHSIGSLVPPDGRTPKFAQFYMYDGQEAVDYCLQFLHTGEPLDPDIVNLLLQMLTRENALLGIFKQIHE